MRLRKTDNFLEKFQKIILHISLYIEDIFDSKIVPKLQTSMCPQKICNMIFRKCGGGEGTKAVWIFSKNHPFFSTVVILPLQSAIS